MLASAPLKGIALPAIALLALGLGAPAASADTFTVTDQAEFEAAVTAATQSGRSDTIDVNAVNVSSPAMMFPAAASSLVVNFNGVSGGPAVYNPTFDVGFGTLGQTLGVGPGTTLNFNTTNGIASWRIGFADGVNAGSGTVNMTGGTVNGIYSGVNNYTTMNVGRGSQDSHGTFNQSGGSIFLNGGAFNLGVAEATGTYTMSGDAKIDMGPGTVCIGCVDGNGTLNIGGNAQFLVNDGDPPPGHGQIHIGRDGGTALIIQDGAGSRVVLNAQNGTHFGLGGGTGEYRLSAGQLFIGGLGSGTAGLNLGDSAGGTGTFTQTGGQLTLNTGQIRFGTAGVGTGTYNLNGGTLQVGVANPFATATANYEFNLGGGTIQALTGFSTGLDFSLTGGTSTIDTNGFNATFSGVLDGVGGLNKAGGGVLLLNGANTYTGGTLISGGTLRLGADDRLASSGAVQIASAATFDLNDNSQTIGAFSGAGIVDLGSGALTTDSASNTLFSGSIGGSGSFEKRGGGTLNLTGTSTYTGATILDGGALMVNGSLASPVTVESGTLGGNATLGGLIVAGSGIASPGNSIGTIQVNGIVVFQPQSVYHVEVGAKGSADLIRATGTATMNGGNVVVSQLGGPLSLAAPYTIVTAAGGRNGTFDSVSGNFTFVTPTLEYDANNVYLMFARNGIDFVDVAQTRNQRAVAAALDQSPAGNELTNVILSGTEAGARQAVDALSGEIHASAAGVMVMNSFYVRDAIFSRLIQATYSAGGSDGVALGAVGPTTVAMLDPGRMSLGAGPDDFGATGAPASGHGLAFWTRGFGAWGDLNGNGNAAGLDRSLGGFVSGVDTALGGGWRAGLATGYMQSNVGVGARSSSADIDSYILAGYAGGAAGPFAIRSGGAWTWNSLDTTRNVVFPGFFENERASYDAGTGQLFAEVAYPLLYGPSAIEPFAGLSYVHVGSDGFTESGSEAALTSGGADQNVGLSLLGARAGTTMPLYAMAVTPHASLAWQYAFGDVTPAQAFAFASTGIGFGIAGVPIAQSSALIEAGIDLQLSADARLGIAYVGQLAEDLQDNGVQADLLWRF